MRAYKILADGYISMKTIAGKKYAYLQKKVDGKLSSAYVNEDILPRIDSELQERKRIKAEIRQADEALDRIENAAKILHKPLYLRLVVLRRCSLMDSASIEERKKALSFGKAMNAIEGLPVSSDTDKSLNSWAIGEGSYRDGYLSVLAKYGALEV
jgi:RNA-binding protein YhbY